MASGPITSWEINGETVETVSDFIFWGSKITADGDCSYEIKRCLLLARKVMTNLDSILKSRDITLPTKVRLVKAMVFPVWTGHVETYWFDVILLSHKKEWGCTIFSNMEGPRNYHTKWSKSEREIKIAYDITHMGNLKYNTNEQIYETSYELWCWRRLESPLDCKEIQPVHPKGNQSSILFARTNDEAETPILWPPDVKNWLIWKDPDTGKDWRREEKGTSADEMVGWHHQLSRHETE